MAKLAIPGMLLLVMESWAFEIGTLLSGLLGKTELGAQSIIIQFEALSFMACFTNIMSFFGHRRSLRWWEGGMLPI